MMRLSVIFDHSMILKDMILIRPAAFGLGAVVNGYLMRVTAEARIDVDIEVFSH